MDSLKPYLPLVQITGVSAALAGLSLAVWSRIRSFYNRCGKPKFTANTFDYQTAGVIRHRYIQFEQPQDQPIWLVTEIEIADHTKNWLRKETADDQVLDVPILREIDHRLIEQTRRIADINDFHWDRKIKYDDPKPCGRLVLHPEACDKLLLRLRTVLSTNLKIKRKATAWCTRPD